MKIYEQYEKETGKKWWIAPVCHGDRGYCSDDYMNWLQEKLTTANRAVEACNTIKKMLTNNGKLNYPLNEILSLVNEETK